VRGLLGAVGVVVAVAAGASPVFVSRIHDDLLVQLNG